MRRTFPSTWQLANLQLQWLVCALSDTEQSVGMGAAEQVLLNVARRLLCALHRPPASRENGRAFEKNRFLAACCVRGADVKDSPRER